MTYSKIGSKIYDDYYNAELINYFAEENNYNILKLYTYIYDNENLTLEQDGIEYSFGPMYTEEEFEIISKQWEEEFQEYWESLTDEEKEQFQGAIGNGNPLIFTELKLDFKNGLKNYDESLIPYYYFFEETKQHFDGSKDKTLTFEIGAEFDLFDKVYVNGKEIDKSNYEAKSGSTVITLKEDYLKTLKDGEYTLKVTFTDNEFAQTTFTVKQAVTNPDTGIDLGYGAMLLLILVSGAAYVLIRKQSKFKHN